MQPATRSRALLIGSSPAIADLARTLLDLGYHIETHSDVEAAARVWSHGLCDIVVMSVSSEASEPFAPVAVFRKRCPQSKIVIVSDLEALDERVAGLDAGADDYITVPFATAEFRARLGALIRHGAARKATESRVGSLLIRSGDPTVLIGGVAVNLSPRERALLDALARAVPNIVEKRTLAEQLAVSGHPMSSSAVEILIHRLRRRLAPFGVSIITVRGAGYRLQFAEDLPHPATHAEVDTVALEREGSKSPDVPLGESLPDAEPQGWNTRLLEFTNDAIIIWEMQGRGILYWNAAAERLYGYSRTTALGQVTHLLLKTELTGGVTNLESSLARYGVWIGELTHTRSDGRRVLVEGRLALMSQRNDRWLVLEVNRDITDRKALELSRDEMQRQLEGLRNLRGP